MFAWLKNTILAGFQHDRSDFASIASHELRTPLSIIKWYTEILLDEDSGTLTEDQKKYLRVIESSNERAISLVTSLLNVSRLELNTFSVSPEPLLFPTVMEEVLKKLEPKWKAKNILLAKNLGKNFPLIQADKRLVYLIFKELVSNAVSFSKEGGSVAVSMEVTPSLVVCKIKDYGIGIKDYETKKVFTKMFRGSNVTDEEKGSGLGLYIVKQIMSKTGGSIFFSTQEDVGSTFSVSFPVTGMSKKVGKTCLDIGV